MSFTPAPTPPSSNPADILIDLLLTLAIGTSIVYLGWWVVARDLALPKLSLSGAFGLFVASRFLLTRGRP